MRMNCPDYSFPPLHEQRETFDVFQSLIDRNLRRRGFVEVFAKRGIDVSVGKIVVGRDFTYSSQLADISRDLDPLATRMATVNEVGLSISDHGARSWNMFEISTSLMSDDFEPSGIGLELDAIQHQSVHDSLRMLDLARRTGILSYLTKSRLKIDMGGD